MLFRNGEDFADALREVLEKEGGLLRVKGTPDSGLVDRLAHNSVFQEDLNLRAECRQAVRLLADREGSFPASIQEVYEARGRGEISGFTVPAVNIRGLTYEVARALFRAARKSDTGLVICELARSEMGYTFQDRDEYAVVILAAALRERHGGPVFIQGDHFQFSPKRYAQDPGKETEEIRALTQDAIQAGFYNIDIDASTLVDLRPPTLDQQQETNYRLSAEVTAWIRSLEPEGVTVSIGGEIGEVGGKNSTVEELRAYLDGYYRLLRERGVSTGISKVSVQTGTSHGGVPLPDGRVAEVELDFQVLRDLGRVARSEYGLAGAVQHGASTLPDEAFDKFPEHETAEIHLATGFQNLLLDHPSFPGRLRTEIYSWLQENCADERKPGMTDEQFFYKTRKKSFGPFKRTFWDLPEEVRAELALAAERKFEFYFEKLAVTGSRKIVESRIRRPEARAAARSGR